MTETLFISDLHLSAKHPATVELFLHFLGGRARGAESLYILGDLFDSWIGDDDTAPPIADIIAGLKELSGNGTRTYLLPGNRDFLLGEDFMTATRIALLKDPHLTQLAGTATLLMHGDLLCTDDLEYQQTRRMLRSETFIQDFLARSIEERRAIAADYRKRSGEATSLKPDDIMDVNQGTVCDTMRKHGVQRLIHGHTHRPGRHKFDLDGKTVERIVLAQWHEHEGSVLCVTESGIVVEKLCAE